VPFYCAQDYEKIRSVYGAVLSKFTVKIRIAEPIDLGCDVCINENTKCYMEQYTLVEHAEYRTMGDNNLLVCNACGHLVQMHLNTGENNSKFGSFRCAGNLKLEQKKFSSIFWLSYTQLI
jgi:hypothetical protein